MALAEEGNVDQFDRLPDALLRLIFNKLHDAQSLTRSMSVCKRFASIIPENETVSLKIPRKISLKQQPYDRITKPYCADCSRRGGSKGLLKSLIRKIITRPIQFLLRVITSRSIDNDDTDCCFYSPNEVLKNFKEIQSLRIELPPQGGEIGSDGGDSLIRWRAEFGREMESCVIFGANSFHKKSSKNPGNGEEIDGQQPDREVLLTDDDLKLRIVWTISCLIAASARHYLLRQAVSEHPMLRSVVVADGSKQGRMCMNREQIEELKKNVVDSEAESERTAVPALKMRLWYQPELELPVAGTGAGCVMKGATLLVIRRVDGAKKGEIDGDLVERVWDWDEEEGEEEKVFGEAVREMLKKKRTCTLEMNSF